MTADALLISIVWTIGALYASLLAGGLLRNAIDDERARKKNGLRKILSRGNVRQYRLLFAIALLFLIAGLVSLLVPPGTAWVRFVFASIFISAEWLLVVLLKRAERQRRYVLSYDLREDRAEVREARADAREDRADAREDRIEARLAQPIEEVPVATREERSADEPDGKAS